MDKLNPMDQSGLSSYDSCWEKWRTEQVQTITQILSHVFKAEDEARQIQAPSRLLRNSCIDSPEKEVEIRKKLTQIREQISEYEQMLKLGIERIESALEELNPSPASPSEHLPRTTSLPLKKKTSTLKKWMKKFRSCLPRA